LCCHQGCHKTFLYAAAATDKGAGWLAWLEVNPPNLTKRFTLPLLSCCLPVLQANLDKPFYVWGEDALLSWPGAEAALITERDTFMARVLAATATGTNSNAPAFIAEQVRGSSHGGHSQWYK
jgi:hypothetical protein